MRFFPLLLLPGAFVAPFGVVVPGCVVPELESTGVALEEAVGL